jgi:hypothetical protein
MGGVSYPAGSELDSLLIRVFNAYRQGLRRLPQVPSVMPSRDFESLTFLGTLGRMPPEHRLILRDLYRICGAGLGAAREGRLEDAMDYYGMARESLGRLESGTARFLGESKYQAWVAYLEFRRGDPEQARERLDHAMDADLELERTGLSVMQMHRIQQGHNLARMDFRLGHRDSAVRLTGMLLAYMEGQTHELPYHRDWRSRSLQAVPRSLRQAMIHQVLGETAGYIVTGDTPRQEWRGLVETARPCRDPETAIFPQAQYALWAQYERLRNNQEQYLRNLERFFSSGIRHCHFLWYAVLIDLVDFCREVDTRHSRQVWDVLLRDSAKWKGLPSFLRDRLHSPASQRHVA